MSHQTYDISYSNVIEQKQWDVAFGVRKDVGGRIIVEISLDLLDHPDIQNSKRLEPLKMLIGKKPSKAGQWSPEISMPTVFTGILNAEGENELRCWKRRSTHIF